MTKDVQPPISSAAAAPTIERREDIKSHRIQSIQQARDQLKDVRIASQRRQSKRGYTRAQANTDYLIALQSLLVELEPLYNRLGACQEYWTNRGEPIEEVYRPGLEADDVLDVPPSIAYTGTPQLLNPEVLKSQHLLTINSLKDLLDLESARVGYSFTLYPKHRNVDPQPINDTVPLPRTALDKALRWSVEFMEEIGLTVADSDSGDLVRMPQEGNDGDD